MIKYYKLFDLLNRKGMRKTDLLEIISAPTLSKLGKGETIKTDIIDKVCSFLQCQPADIMEHIENEYIEQLDIENKNYKTKIIEQYITTHDVLDDSVESELFVKISNDNDDEI